MNDLARSAFDAIAAVLARAAEVFSPPLLPSSSRPFGAYQATDERSRLWPRRLRRCENPQRRSVRAALRRASKNRRKRKAARAARKIKRRFGAKHKP